MKFSIDLQTETKPEWVTLVLNNIEFFLQDHANCERKASSMMMSFVAKYPNRLEIIPDLIETAIEELGHFQDVYKIMESRGIPLRQELEQDHYVNQLNALCRTSPEERFLDRLLISSVVECRGAERFKLVYQAVEDEELKKFYHRLWAAEAKHGNLFVKMSLLYFDEKSVYDRLQFFVKKEAEILNSLELKPAFH